MDIETKIEMIKAKTDNIKTNTTSCSYKGCCTKLKDKQIRKFYFPASVERCERWIKNSGNDRLLECPSNVIRNYFICAKHFSNESFKNSSKHQLNWNAVPLPLKTVLGTSEPPETELNHKNREESQYNLSEAWFKSNDWYTEHSSLHDVLFTNIPKRTYSLDTALSKRLYASTPIRSSENITEYSSEPHDHSKERQEAIDEVIQDIKPDPDTIAETQFEPVFITASYELPTVNQSIPSIDAGLFPSSSSQSYAIPVTNTVQPIALCKINRSASLVNDISRTQLPTASSTNCNRSVLPANEIRPIKLQSSCSEICRTKQKRLVKRLIFASQKIKSLKLTIQKQNKSMATLRKVVKRLKNKS